MLRSILVLVLFLTVVPPGFTQSVGSVSPSTKTVPIWRVWGGVNPYASGPGWQVPRSEIEEPVSHQNVRNRRRPVLGPQLRDEQNEGLKVEIIRLREVLDQRLMVEQDLVEQGLRHVQSLKIIEKEREQLKQENRELKSKLAGDAKQQGRPATKNERESAGRVKKGARPEGEVRRLTAEMKAQQKKVVDQIKGRFKKKIERLENEGADEKEITKMRGEMMRQIITQIDRIGTRYHEKIGTLKKNK